MNKKSVRLRRAKKTRARIRQQGVARFCVHRTPRHIYAQVIAADGAKVVACASTVEKAVREQAKNTGNSAAAAIVGKTVAERSVKAGVSKVAFDRSGFKFHGRIKALADAARAAGMEF